MKNFMRKIKNSKKGILARIYYIGLAALLALFALCAIALYFCKDEYIDKSGTSVEYVLKLQELEGGTIVPKEIKNFSFHYKKRGWYSSIFWTGFLDKNSFEKFAKNEGFAKIPEPPIYDFLIEDALGIKISKPYEVYERRDNSHFIYIYEASERIVGFYLSK